MWPCCDGLSDTAIAHSIRTHSISFPQQTLAKKVVTLFRLAGEQLTKHCHYDWSLRSLRSVLSLASQMRQQQPDLPEAVILIRSLHEINLSKLVFEDVPLFLGIIKVSANCSSPNPFRCQKQKYTYNHIDRRFCVKGSFPRY